MEEMIQWEQENVDNITGWIVDWEIEIGFKVVTFTLKDKSNKVFKIKL